MNIADSEQSSTLKRFEQITDLKGPLYFHCAGTVNCLVVVIWGRLEIFWIYLKSPNHPFMCAQQLVDSIVSYVFEVLHESSLVVVVAAPGGVAEAPSVVLGLGPSYTSARLVIL